MNLIPRLFRKRSPSDCARQLNEHRHLSERERIRATARQMRAELGLPPLEVLR